MLPFNERAPCAWDAAELVRFLGVAACPGSLALAATEWPYVVWIGVVSSPLWCSPLKGSASALFLVPVPDDVSFPCTTEQA